MALALARMASAAGSRASALPPVLVLAGAWAMALALAQMASAAGARARSTFRLASTGDNILGPLACTCCLVRNRKVPSNRVPRTGRTKGNTLALSRSEALLANTGGNILGSVHFSHTDYPPRNRKAPANSVRRIGHTEGSTLL